MCASVEGKGGRNLALHVVHSSAGFLCSGTLDTRRDFEGFDSGTDSGSEIRYRYCLYGLTVCVRGSEGQKGGAKRAESRKLRRSREVRASSYGYWGAHPTRACRGYEVHNMLPPISCALGRWTDLHQMNARTRKSRTLPLNPTCII